MGAYVNRRELRTKGKMMHVYSKHIHISTCTWACADTDRPELRACVCACEKALPPIFPDKVHSNYELKCRARDSTLCQKSQHFCSTLLSLSSNTNVFFFFLSLCLLLSLFFFLAPDMLLEKNKGNAFKKRWRLNK